MEKYRKNPTDKELSDIMKHVYENALGNPVVMDSEPTAGDLKPNNLVYYGGNIYLRLPNGEAIKITGAKI